MGYGTLRNVLSVCLVCAMVLPTACQRVDRVRSEPGRLEVVQGTTAPSGKLIIYEERNLKVDPDNGCLRGQYGMMVFYDQWAKQPAPPRFELYFQDSKQIVKAPDLKAFELALQRVPRGSTLEWYDTCTASRHAGIDDQVIQSVKQLCAKRRITLYGDDEDEAFPGHLICYCID